MHRSSPTCTPAQACDTSDIPFYPSQQLSELPALKFTKDLYKKEMEKGELIGYEQKKLEKLGTMYWRRHGRATEHTHCARNASQSSLACRARISLWTPRKNEFARFGLLCGGGSLSYGWFVRKAKRDDGEGGSRGMRA
jgi:hypothetical protein